jgi:hypothetical protein
MAELGNGKRFFDFGSGWLRNIMALQIPKAF